jgi:spore coat polysaccharide biosynthesis protein SpsF (cytidylyltransferase family)
MGSKRLPGKVLLPLNGHTVIEEVLTRCKRIPGVDEVVCAIPRGKKNLPLSEVALRHVTVWHGPEFDVLTRYREAAEFVGADIIMRVTGDCPLICPGICADALFLLIGGGFDYVGNVDPRTFPQGYDCEVFTRKTLDRAVGPDEHVTTWMRTAPDVNRTNLTSTHKMEGRLTLDTEDDYRTICAYFGHEPHQHLRAA